MRTHRLVPTVVFLLLIGLAPAPSAVFSAPPVLQAAAITSRPERVFKVDDPRGGSESWSTDLVVTVAGTTAARITEIVERLRSGDRVVTTRTLGAEAVAELVVWAPEAPEGSTSTAIRLRYSTPREWEVDAVDLDLEIDGRRVGAQIRVGRYEQMADLVFPFVGPGIITQGGISNAGHGHPTGQFAVDAIGLTEMYAPQVRQANANDSYAGWGRTIVAPGAGTVVWARDGVPDQLAPGVNDPESFVLSDGTRAITGNTVVIDHGSGEFSVVMHMMQGSIRVAVGDRVNQGDAIGRLGSSGDSFGPHVHYQLQDAPVPLQGSALPMRFTNTSETLVRGVYFDPEGPSE